MSVTDQVIMNNFVNSVDDAIKSVGGDTSSVQHLCDYPKIIREQLVATGVEFDINEGNGIQISKDGVTYTISANSNATTVDALNSGNYIIPKDTSIQEVFNKLFKNILPTLPSVISGDIIYTDRMGRDQYQHPNGDPNTIRIKTNLLIESPYLRLFLASQEEPIYIYMGELGGGVPEAPSDGKVYGRQNKQWVEISDNSGEIADIKSDIVDLKLADSNINTNLEIISSNVSKNTERIVSLTDTINNVAGSVSCINSSISAINKDIEELKEADKQILSEIDTTNKKLNNTISAVAQNKKDIGVLQESDSNQNEAIKKIKQDIEDLKNGDTCVTTSPLSPPHPTDTDIPAGTPFQKVFELLFDVILPATPSVIKGDIITSNDKGNDIYQHPHSQSTNVKSGLDPNTQYIRLFINSQEEPIYISCDPLNAGGEINPDDILSAVEAAALFDSVFKS